MSNSMQWPKIRSLESSSDFDVKSIRNTVEQVDRSEWPGDIKEASGPVDIPSLPDLAPRKLSSSSAHTKATLSYTPPKEIDPSEDDIQPESPPPSILALSFGETPLPSRFTDIIPSPSTPDITFGGKPINSVIQSCPLDPPSVSLKKILSTPLTSTIRMSLDEFKQLDLDQHKDTPGHSVLKHRLASHDEPCMSASTPKKVSFSENVVCFVSITKRPQSKLPSFHSGDD